jgi:TM2 domain-containing membrane protein YozV
MRLGILVLLFIVSFGSQAQLCEEQVKPVHKALVQLQKNKHERLVAIGLNVSLGMLGVHRMYLGTGINVPVTYACTAGGFGVLWVTDLAILVGTRHYEALKNNPHVFLWNHN